jgi:putative MFS transporter
MDKSLSPRKINQAIAVAALGYFVDIFDLLLFGIVRVQSLKDLGISGDALLSEGVYLLNMQMIGLLIGGLFWGILGDKIGRIQVLFGSILLYSTATFLNGFVQDVQSYAILRFISGIGLAGELGAGITLVSELVSKERRGLATALIATVGVSGAVVAGVTSKYLDWRSAYMLGGFLGFLLLFLRMGVNESGIFRQLAESTHIKRGSLKLLLKPERMLKFLACVLMAVPIWYMVGIIVTFSPEISVSLKISGTIDVATAIAINYIGFTFGDMLSGVVSQLLKSRKKCLLIFMLASLVFSVGALSLEGYSTNTFYLFCGLMGLAGGYWAMFVTTAAEQFGTNIRATVTTTTPNLVRGAVVPMTFLFSYLKPDYGVVAAAQITGLIVFILGLLALSLLEETFGKDLDFVEE